MGFTALGGPSACGVGLLTWLQGNSEEFVAKVQKVVMSWHMNRSDEPCRLDTVKLKPSHMRQIGMELQAGILFTMDHNSATDDAGSWTVKATLGPVKQVWRRGSTSARNLAAGGSRRSKESSDSREGRPTRRKHPADPGHFEA